jgi:two-component system chemotaxis response regulator CheB
MGTSTGGPSAALEVLRALPADFDLPILLCIHIAEPFGAAFADWLDGLVPRPVAYARGGEPIASMRGRVVLAPPTAHLIVRAGAVELDGGAPRHSCRPSVDVLFESVAREVGAAAIGCLMTGMGRDGAEGLLAMRQAGAATIAQDEATSVVYGMPREAARIGAAASVLPLSEIAPALARLQREVARG